MFLCGVRRNTCTTPFLNAQELHFCSTLKANVCIFLYISLKKHCFRDVASFYLVVGGWWGWQNKFLKAVRSLALAKYFTTFYNFLTIFENSTIFSISILLFIALKRWNFPDYLDFKGKIGATFHISRHFLSI